jgi:hypothetical protein
MNTITDSYLIAHAFELRLLMALIVILASISAIKIAVFISSVSAPLLVKIRTLGLGRLSPSAYSAASVS